MPNSIDPGHERSAPAGRRTAPADAVRRIACRRWLFRALAFVSAAATAVGASAQTSPTDSDQPTPRPAHRPVPVANESLSMNVSVSGTTSDDRYGDTAVNPRPAAYLDTSLSYHLRGKHTVFDLGGQSSVRRVDQDVSPTRQMGALDFSAAGQRQQFHTSQNVSYMPSYQFGGLLGTAVPPELDGAASHGDLANSPVWGLMLNSNLDWDWTLGPKLAMQASYIVRSTRFGVTGLDMTTQAAGGRFTRRLSRYFALQTGYAYRIANSEVAPGELLRVNDINIGIDFSRPLKERGTIFSFRSGSSVVPSNGGQAFRVTGDMSIVKQMGRTWKARASVDRSVRLIEGFTDPVLDNSLTGGIGGNLTQHWGVFAAGTLSTGTVGVTTGLAHGYHSWTTPSRMSLMPGRRAVLNAQYLRVGNQFEDGVVLPPQVVAQLRRQGIRIDMTWHFAIFQN